MTTVCKRCVMDNSAYDFYETTSGCNFCDEFESKYPRLSSGKDFTAAEVEKNLNEIFQQVFTLRNEDSEYDCLLGLSGGLDSCYALHLILNLGLNPLVVHMDNGWNSEIAQNNIEGLVRTHNLDLVTKVLRWTEYRDLQKAFFQANVIDIELLYDHAAIATCYKVAKENNIRVVIAGTNLATEGFRMPTNWAWVNKMDALNIKSIWKREGNGKEISDFPFYSSFDYIKDSVSGRIKWISVIDKVNYDKAEAEKILGENYGFKPYPYKHYESIFTRFYQGFILPVKFGVDKRKNHLSTLILTKKMERVEAMEILSKDPYPNEEELAADRAYFLKKFQWNDLELDRYMKKLPKSHWEYRTEERYLRAFRIIDSILFRIVGLLTKFKFNKSVNINNSKHQTTSNTLRKLRSRIVNLLLRILSI